MYEMFDTIPMSFCFGLALDLANKLMENAMSCIVWSANYITAPIVAKYKVSAPKHISPSSKFTLL